MPIYDGTQKVAPYGIQSVYDGNTKVYEKAPATKFTAVATVTDSFNGCGAVLYNNKIYIFGGGGSSPSARACVFDPSDNSITNLTSLPGAKIYTSAVTWPQNNTQYIGIIGGGPDIGSTTPQTWYRYDINTDSYTSYNASRGLSNRLLFYAPTQQYVYSSGGTNKVSASGSGSGTPSRFNLSNSNYTESTFTDSSDLGFFDGGAECYYNGTQYIFGTVTAKIDSVSYSNGIPQLNILYSFYDNFRKQFNGAGFTIYNGDCYVIGSRSGTYKQEIYKYNLSTGIGGDTGDLLPEAITTTANIKAFTIGNAIYILINTTIYKYTPSL